MKIIVHLPTPTPRPSLFKKRKVIELPPPPPWWACETTKPQEDMFTGADEECSVAGEEGELGTPSEAPVEAPLDVPTKLTKLGPYTYWCEADGKAWQVTACD